MRESFEREVAGRQGEGLPQLKADLEKRIEHYGQLTELSRRVGALVRELVEIYKTLLPLPPRGNIKEVNPNVPADVAAMAKELYEEKDRRRVQLSEAIDRNLEELEQRGEGVYAGKMRATLEPLKRMMSND